MRQFNPRKKELSKKLRKKYSFKNQILFSRAKSKRSKSERDDDLGEVSYINGVKHIQIKSKK